MRCPFAAWMGPIPNQLRTGTVRPARGLVLHVMEGTLEGTDGWFHNPASQASAHFGVGKDGRLWQWVDTAAKAWAQAAGNAEWYSVETEGYDTEALTPAQIATAAHLLAWLHGLDGFALQVTDDIHGSGLIIHSDGGAAWGGHYCPGDIRSHQRGEIVARAKGVVAVPPPAPAPGPIVHDYPGETMRRIDVQVSAPLADGTGYWDLFDLPWEKFCGVSVNGGGVPTQPHRVEASNQDGHTRLWLGGFELNAKPLLLVLAAD